MSLLTKPYTFSSGATIIAAQHNSNFDTLYSDYNGNLQNVNIAAGAGITYNKLNLTSSLLYTDLSASAIASLISTIIPSGIITAWSGSILSVPSGWFLCDGTHNTPNLTNRFIIAADATNYPVGATGDGTIPAHTHSITAGGGSSGPRQYIAVDTDLSDPEPKITDSYGTGTQVISVYYSLAYIMKA